MASFDVVSEIDMQEVRNAVDQAMREITNRYDFKGTDTSIELTDEAITLQSSATDRLAAARVVLEEKMVRRNVSLKSIDMGDEQDAAGGTVRQVATLKAGITSDDAKSINKFIKGLGLKGVQSQTQGDQVRVISKKRDDLQTIIAELKGGPFELPLQFENFRD